MADHSSEPVDIVGTILNKKYEVQQRLSQGGMGVVYKARHLTLDTPVAIKVLLKPEDKVAQERFLSEARLASKIRHPNTVYIADFGVLDDGRAFLEMEFLAGRTLADELTKGRMAPSRACHIAMQIARGLQAVHDKGIVHRDMKPDNVFLLQQDGSADFVKIVDFGIAKAQNKGSSTSAEVPKQPSPGRANTPKATPMASLDKTGNRPKALTETGTVLGTPGFMAPEQIEGKPCDARVDQYALGCMLYEMIAGEPVFDAANNMALMMKHMTLSPQPLQKRCPTAGVSASLDALVLRLLAREPGQRLPSMRAVEEALQGELDRLLTARGGKSRSSIAELSRFPVQPRRPIWLIAAIGVCCAVVLGTLAYRLTRNPTATGEVSAQELAALRAQAIGVLRQNLKSSDGELRAAAVVALGQSRDEAVREELESLLKSNEPALRALAATALGTLGDRRAISKLGELLSVGQEPPQTLAAAAGALRQLGDPRGQRFLELTLDSKDPELQFRAALLFCDQGPKDAQRILRNFAGRASLPPPTLLNILLCLARSGEQTALARLRAQMNETGPSELRLQASAKLAALGEADGLKYLRDAARKKSREQILAARELALLDEPDGQALFREVVSKSDAQSLIRRIACDGLGAVGEASDARPLAALLGPTTEGNSDSALSQAAARAIVEISGRDPSLMSAQSMGWARSALADGDALVRQSAADILGDSLADGAVSLLAGMLSDSDVAVRRQAVAALGKQRTSTAVLALRHALADSDERVRQESLRSLIRIGEGLLATGLGDAATPLQTTLAGLVDSGTPSERLQSAALLLRLGDTSQLKRLRDWLSSPEADLRRLALELLPSSALSKDDLARLLGDSGLAVRLLAARKLALLGDRRAIPVLREAIDKASPDALLAYGLLGRLGAAGDTAGAIEPLLDKTLADGDGPKRVEAVRALAGLSPTQARPYLLRAARDRDPLVRRATLDALDELTDSTDDVELRKIAQRLSSDPDAAVRARALALLARRAQAKLDAAGTKSNPASAVKPPEPAVAKTDKENASVDPTPGTASPSTPTSGAVGQLVLEGPSGVQFSVDHRPWQAVSDKLLVLEAGPHTINFLSGQSAVTIIAGQTVRLKITTSQVEQLARAGNESFARGDFKKAQRQMEKAIGLCSREHEKAAQCAQLSFELRYHLGEIHEKAKEWPEAMDEYQEVLAISDKVRGKADIKSGTQAAVARLAPRLGQVIVPKNTKRGCQEEIHWLRPGPASIKVDSKFEQIEVKAREVVRVGKCR